MIRRPLDAKEAGKPPVMAIRVLAGDTVEVATSGEPQSIVFWANTLLSVLRGITTDTEDLSGVVWDLLKGIGKEKTK